MKRKNKYDVGTIHKSNNFGDVEIICRVDNTKRVVKFLDTGYTKNYTLSAIDKGRMQDDTKVIGEFTVGSLHKTNMSGDVKIISFNNANDIEIEFMNTGNKSKCTKANLAKGLVRDELEYVYRGKYSEGSIHKTKFCGDVLVLKVLDDGKRLIQFMNTGNTKKITKHKLSTATDKEHLYHTTGKYRIGSVHKSNNCGNFEIIGRTDNNQERIIKFLNTGVETTTTISRIREGCVYDKSVLEYSLYYCLLIPLQVTTYETSCWTVNLAQG